MADLALVGPLGPVEIIIILVLILLIFGAKRLPEMGRALGSGMREFKDSVTGKDRDDRDQEQLERPAKTEAAADARPAETATAASSEPPADDRAATSGAGTAGDTRS